MSLTSEDVKHIAKLAKLEMSDVEIDKFLPQLQGILKNAELLNEVDTEGVEPIAQITGLESVTFEDEVQACDFSEKLLAQSPMEIQANMIKVKNIL